MKRLSACLLCAAVLFALGTGQCFASPEASLQKVIASMFGITEADPPKVVLTQAEEDELIDEFIAYHKGHGREFTRQQAAMLIGQLAGFTALAIQVSELFGDPFAGGEPEKATP